MYTVYCFGDYTVFYDRALDTVTSRIRLLFFFLYDCPSPLAWGREPCAPGLCKVRLPSHWSCRGWCEHHFYVNWRLQASTGAVLIISYIVPWRSSTYFTVGQWVDKYCHCINLDKKITGQGQWPYPGVHLFRLVMTRKVVINFHLLYYIQKESIHSPNKMRCFNVITAI